MFWRKKKTKDTSPAVITGDLSNATTVISHIKYANLDLRRAVLDWRDRHIENVEQHLKLELNSLYRSIDQQLEKMSIRDLFNQADFGEKHIAPIYKEWVTRQVTQLSYEAQDDLAKVFTHALEFGDHGGTLDQQSDSGPYADAALAAIAAGAGVAAIPTFAAMSVVSAGGIMGFLGATTIALPVVAAGVATVGALLALSGYKAASLKSGAIRRYGNGITQSIERQVLGLDGDQKSICKRLQLYIKESAEKIILEIDQ